MVNDNRRSQKVKEDESIKSKKKTVTPDASPAPSSRRSSRDTPSPGKQKKESAVKENVINTRKSKRLETRKPSGTTTPVKGKSEKTHEQVATPPTKKNDRRMKFDASPVSPATLNAKSKKKKVAYGSRKRKRVGTKGLSKPLQVSTEEGDDDDEKESEERLSEASSSSSSCREVVKPDSLKSVKDKDDSDDDCGDSNGEECTVKASESQSKTSDVKELLNDDLIDLEQDRIPCEATAIPEIVEKNNGVSRTDTNICIACNRLRCGHLPLVIESIWDSRELEVSRVQGLQRGKQYFVKYDGLAHIHNQWITENELLLEAPMLLENYKKNGSKKWNEDWTRPHQLLKKRLFLSLEPVCESQENSGNVLKNHYEWLVQWQGLDYEQATWETENISVLDSPEGHSLIKDYATKHASSDNDRIEEVPVNLPTVFAGCPAGMDNIHLSYVKNLHDAWTKGQISIVFDDQERTTRIVLFILSLASVSHPFLLITRSDSLSQWEAMFSKLAPFNAFKVSIKDTHENASSKLINVRKEGGQLAFQLLLYSVDAFVKDLNVLKAIKWEGVVVDESQSSYISSHFSHIKSLSTDKKLLVFCGPLGVSNLDVMPLLDCGVITKTELDDISKLKETLSKLIAYECKSNSSKFLEYWVPVQISNVQLEQYCSMLLSNAMALSACSKSDSTGALRNILLSNRKCCDHPYIVDQSLQAGLTKGLELAKFLDVGIKASGKLQFLDLILPEMRKRQLRVLIVFQPLSGSGKDSTSIGDILDDFVRQRFGEDSYERVDGIGMIPSKKQAALNNFNNKEMGRFIFLLEHRACLPSIKLSSVDTIIIFSGDCNPANDLRALQKIAIDSHLERIMVFRLYTSLTLEENILRLAEHNVTIDSKLQNISRSTIDELLMWGAKYLFKKLDEFHSDLNIASEECWLSELLEEFVDLLSYKCNNKDAGKLKITRAKPSCGKTVTFPSEIDGERPHAFWRNLLAGREPCWKYLSASTPRQRSIKRPQYFEESPKNDDVGRKRKKITNNISEPAASKPVIEGEVTDNVVDTVASQPVIEEGEMSFQDLLKLKISKLCEVFKLPEDVKTMVERFLEYVIENYRVDKEPENTLHAFLISLCWIGSELLKHKLDRKQSMRLATEQLDFSCKEEEAKSVYLKLELAKEMFLLHTDNLKKTFDSTDILPEVKTEISDSPSNHDGAGDRNQKDGEVGTINPDTSNALEDQNNNNLVQPLSSPASGLSIPTDLLNEFEASLLLHDEEPRLPSENQSNTQQPDSPNPPVLEFSAQVANQGVFTPHGKESGNSNQGATQKKSYDPLQTELERLRALTNNVVRFYEDIKLKLKSDHDKELAEITAKINAKYEAKNQETDAAFQSKKKEVETNFNRVVMNIVLADAFKSKCHDLSPICPSEAQDSIPSGGIQHNLPQFQGQGSSPTQSSRNPQATGLQPPLQIVDQSSKLFSTPPSRPPFNYTNPSTRPPPSNTIPSTRPPPSNTIPSTRPPPSNTIPSTRPPPFNTTPSTRPPSSNTTPSTRPPSSNTAPSTRPPPSNTIPSTRPPPPNTAPSTRPPPSNTTPSTGPPPSDTTPSTIPPPSNTIPSTRPPPPNTNPSTRPPPSTIVSTRPPNRPPFSPSIPSKPPPAINPITSSSRPINPIAPSSRPINPIAPSSRPINPIAPTSSTNPLTPTSRSIRPPPYMIPPAPPLRNLRISEIRAPAPHIRPFRLSTPASPHDQRVMPSHHPFSSPPLSQTSARPLPSQKPPHYMTNHNNHPSRNSPRSSPLTSSQPVAPPASFQLPPSYSWRPPVTLPAMSSSHPHMSLPPMPSVSISHTGLYHPTPDILSRPATDLLMDVEKQVGVHPPNTSTPPPPEFRKEGGGSDLVCLSDDDD